MALGSYSSSVAPRFSICNVERRLTPIAVRTRRLKSPGRCTCSRACQLSLRLYDLPGKTLSLGLGAHYLAWNALPQS